MPNRNRNSATGYVSKATEDGDLTPIHGVAIGSNDVTIGHLSGEKKLWPSEILEAAAPTLVGKEIVVDHENRSAREVVGEVTDARFDEEKGIIYQGFLDDDELARKIGHGWLEVSPRIIHSQEMEEKEGLKVPKKIHNIDNLSIVTRGASPSNSVDLGEHSELSAEELQSAFEDVPEGAVAEFQRRESDEELAEDELPDVDFKKFLYGSSEAAYGANQKFGDACKGVHEHVVNGETYYAPCSSHDELVKAMKQREGMGREEMSEVEEMLLSEARTPDYDEKETESWGDIPASNLSYYVENLGYDDVEQWDDLTQEQKEEIASHTLLGDADADTADEGIFFPVVNASTGDLNRGALEAVRSGRGQSADIPQSTYESAYSVAGELLNEEFGTDVPVEFEGQEEEMASIEDQKKRLAGQLSSWAEMTREQAFNLIDTLDPEGANSPVAIAIAAEKGLGVDRDDVLDFLEENMQDMSEDDEEEKSGSAVPVLNRMFG